MTTITFIEKDGTTHALKSETGISVMQLAVDNMIPSIDAECGGGCSCATCHVYLGDEWVSKFPPAEEIEQDLLECVIDQKANSRLSCQLTITEELDGLQITLPDSQF